MTMQARTETPRNALSVVVLSWNRRDEIEACIDAVRSLFSGEIVVVDQGSTDGSREYLETREDIVLIALPENIGAAGGRNVGFKAASGEIILSLDSDARLATDFSFSALDELFHRNPNIAVVDFKLINGYTGELDDWHHPRPPSASLHSFHSTRFKEGAHAIRKSVFEKTSGYDSALFFFWEGVDLAFRILAKGYTIQFSPQHVVFHLNSPTSRVHWQDGRYYYLVRNRIYIARKYFSGYTLFREVAIMITGYFAMAIRNNLVSDYARAISDAFRLPADTRLTTQEKTTMLDAWTHLEKRHRQLLPLLVRKLRASL